MRRLAALGWVLLVSCGGFVLFRSHRRTRRSRALWLQSCCLSALRALGVSFVTKGNPPNPGSIITPNHLGYLDILLLAATTPTVFVAKREVRSWPIFGWFARMAGTRFVDREKRSDVLRVVDELAPVLADGLSVAVFLEGTSSDGRRVLPFKSSLLEPAVQLSGPVVPTALAYVVPANHSVADEVCWWGDMTLPSHLFNLAGLPWIQAFLVWGEPLPPATNRKILAFNAWGAVQTLHRETSLIAITDDRTAPNPVSILTQTV
jgi:1-acyl-sn-glycerol-3-phosphate acyltransferase